MATKNLYDGNGHYIGYYNDTGKQVYAYGDNGAYLGYYDKTSKQTYKATGDLLQINGIEGLGYLIFNQAKHK